MACKNRDLYHESKIKPQKKLEDNNKTNIKKK